MGSRLRESVRFLFEFFCEVSPGDQETEPCIIRKYPESYKNEDELKDLPKFTFPCPLESSFVQRYSFVLTSVDSKYTFCFCRYDNKSNTALVLMSHLPWHDIFYKLLNSISNIMNSPQKEELTSFLDACHIRPPMPGHTLKVTYNAGLNVFSCQCPSDKLPSIPENCNLTEYFSAMDTNCMAGLWAALLHERRVAIVASKPSRLSACVQAANTTLFPMCWQHIFIPILPKHLVDYLLAPMPYLIGVPRSVMETVRMSEIGDIVILDVDRNELKSPFNDLESLPSELVTNLMRDLSDENALGDAVSRAFLRALVCLIGGYRDAIRIEREEIITFNPEAFVRTRRHMQPFLRKIQQSQIFQQFIEERLELLNSGRGFTDEFEVECNRFYSDGLGTGSGQRLKQQYRDWAKNFKKEGGAFFRNVKDKANPAVQSAVKTVRQGGKNMKSAVRGLKNKIPKTGSRPSSINTTTDSRASCGSATPISSDSSSSSPARGGTPRDLSTVPLDLLTEMEFLFNNSEQPRGSPNSSRNNSELSAADRAKTLPSNTPPRVPDRPKLLHRYPIIPIRKLVDLTDAPTPPPRATPSAVPNAHFVSNIVKDSNAPPDFRTSTISFAEFGKDKAKLKLTMSSNPRPRPNSPALINMGGLKALNPPVVEKRSVRDNSLVIHNLERPNDFKRRNGKVKESVGSGSDLIKLDDSPSDLGDFDPLNSRGRDDTDKVPASTTDSALLHEYGLNFSQFGLLDYKASSTSNGQDTPAVNLQKGWTTFN